MNAHKPYNREAGRPLEPASTGVVPEPSPGLGTAPTFPCPECEGVGYFTERAFHPDDPRCEASWDCEECEGTGEVDYETPEPKYGKPLSMEEVERRFARSFGTDVARVEL